VKTVSDKVVRHSVAYLSVQKWFAADVHVKIRPKLTNPFENADFQSIFTRKTIKTNRNSTTSFPMSIR